MLTRAVLLPDLDGPSSTPVIGRRGTTESFGCLQVYSGVEKSLILRPFPKRKITETSKQLKMRSLYQILIVIDDEADSGYLKQEDGHLGSRLFMRGRHFQISTLVSTRLRPVQAALDSSRRPGRRSRPTWPAAGCPAQLEGFLRGRMNVRRKAMEETELPRGGSCCPTTLGRCACYDSCGNSCFEAPPMAHAAPDMVKSAAAPVSAHACSRRRRGHRRGLLASRTASKSCSCETPSSV